MTSNPSIFNLFDLAETLERLGLARVYREAVLTSQDRSHDAGFEFYENAMVNRGLTVRRFRNREDALRWLAEADVVVVPPEVV